jgi:drug/metabolite transporter (DMT)-like permease
MLTSNRSISNPLFVKGVIIMMIAGLILSTGGPIIRNISDASGFQIVFWRSVSQSIFVLVFLLARNGGTTLRVFFDIGHSGLLASVFLGLAFFGFVFSITNTTVANTMFLISTVPFFTALLAWPMLRERVTGVTWIAILVALIGVLVMVSQALTMGKLLGNVMGLFCAGSTALYIICIRWGAVGGRKIDMIPVVCVAGLVAALISFIFEGGRVSVSSNDLIWCLIAGACQNGPGFMLYTMAARYVAAAELSLLGLVEVIIGPIWVWLLFNEIPALSTVTGGIFVLSAVVGLAIWSMYREREN